jgi:hypothetical protein
VEAEALLSAVESGSYGDPGEAMGALAEAVAAINREMVGEPADGIRIRRLVARLHGAAASVAAQSGASGFSISVGLPFGVSVGVEWEHR